MIGMPGPDASFALDENDLVIGEAVALDVRPASALMRAAGTIIDFLASALFFLAIIAAIGYLGGAMGLDESAFAALAVAFLVLTIVVIPATVEFATRGRSLGKLALGLRIVREDGGAIGLRHVLIRALVGVLEIWMTFGGIAALVGLLDAKGRRLGDLLAGTYSQVERVPRVTRSVWSVPVQLQTWAAVADVATLPDPLARRISGFFESASRMSAESRVRLARALAAEVSRYVSPVPQVDAELFVAAVVALRREREAEALRLEAERMRIVEPLLNTLPHSFPHR